MEAEGFAYLAMRSKKGLPLYPSPTTHLAAQANDGGKFHRKS